MTTIFIIIMTTKNFDRENFLLDYLAIEWENELDDDVDSSTSKFFEKMNELIDKYITQAEDNPGRVQKKV